MRILQQKLFKKSNSDYIIVLLGSIQLPNVRRERFNNCESDVDEESLLAALKSMSNNKRFGNNGLSKDYYETSWDEIKDVFLNSFLKKAKRIGFLSVSQREAIIKLLEKKR